MYFDEDDSLFSGSPKEKFFDVLSTANRGVIEKEMEKFLQKYVVMEKMLEDELKVDIESKLQEGVLYFSPENQQRLDDFYIELVAKIVTQNG